MRKEIIISILIGLTLGLVITYGFYSAKLATTEENVTKKDDITQATSSAQEAINGKLVITAPDDELVTTADNITVSGTVNAGNFVVLFVDNTSEVLSVDGDGKFNKTVTLSNGAHILAVTSLDENGDTITEERTIIVTPEENAKPEATASAEIDDAVSPTPGKGSPTPTKSSKLTPTPTKKLATPTPSKKP